MKSYRLRTLLLLSVLCITSTLTAAPKPRKVLYIPMDYSTCGYRASEEAIPDVRNVVYVAWQEGDCYARLQQAIDYVSTLKPDREGRRGAILLGEGSFVLSQPLRISASGIVVRGMGRQQTVLKKTGTDRGAAIYIEGRGGSILGDSIAVFGTKVLAGSTSLSLSSATSLQVGDRIRITRPSTAEWIASLQMNDFGGGLDYTGWKPTDIDICWERTIVGISGQTITLDAPITTTISAEFGSAIVQRVAPQGEISECGIENLGIDAWGDAPANPNERAQRKADEDHCWDGIFMENARDCWVRRVEFSHLSGSAVNVQLHGSRITVEDCLAKDPISEVGGWRRCVFLTRGQQTLFQRCISRNGIHDFAAGYCAAGPNAFVQCEGENSLGFSGSIGSWAAGLLFDIVNIDGHDLCFRNLEQYQFGTGWNTANSMFWQCTASTIWCYSPDADDRCSAHGCWGTLSGNGEWTSSNDHVSPRSLFYAQLQTRLDSLDSIGNMRQIPMKSAKKTADKNLQKPQRPMPHLLYRSTEASSSPTPEQAAEMARISLTEPRLTLEMWQDSIPYTASLKHEGLKVLKQPSATQPSARGDFGIVDGRIVFNNQLLTGNRYDIPWWSGRVKDNFCAHGARPAITRFVPGREGLGWTDRIDSVVNYLDKHHFALLDHNYGLWYDLRRTDHERIRRADGDVWAPFYEQPVARTGQGTAWDGLTRYDLTRPNPWYWSRLRQFADVASSRGILLFNQHYFQHNILEAGAHWVDCPWRPVNNVNHTDTSFPEPVPFTGDKRIFIAEQFYNETDATLRPLHRQYIRMCLDELKDQPNAIHLISAEYTGPLHFTRFWLQTIAEWEAETGCHPLIALSCTKDAQDAILADPILNKVVDIIDIRYWHYNTEGLWAPAAGGNLAPRQWMRKLKVGKTGFAEAYRAVREYRDHYPEKAVTFFSQQYPDYGWAILMAGGSLPNVRINNATLRSHLPQMHPMDDGKGCLTLGNSQLGYLVYVQEGSVSLPVEPGRYTVHQVDRSTGDVTISQKSVRLSGVYEAASADAGTVIWLEKK
ncbi:MAG: DUF6298 domain-containing protein [Prevotella sp.]|nr:DUF6298 domain-containing protein [Prevotella sp.]